MDKHNVSGSPNHNKGLAGSSTQLCQFAKSAPEEAIRDRRAIRVLRSILTQENVHHGPFKQGVYEK